MLARHCHSIGKKNKKNKKNKNKKNTKKNKKKKALTIVLCAGWVGSVRIGQCTYPRHFARAAGLSRHCKA